MHDAPLHAAAIIRRAARATYVRPTRPEAEQRMGTFAGASPEAYGALRVRARFKACRPQNRHAQRAPTFQRRPLAIPLKSGRGRQVPRFLVNNARDVRLTVPDCVTTACDFQPNMAQHSPPICGPGSIEVDDVKNPVQRPCVGYTLSYVEENNTDKASLIVASPRSRALLSPHSIPILRGRNL